MKSYFYNGIEYMVQPREEDSKIADILIVSSRVTVALLKIRGLNKFKNLNDIPIEDHRKAMEKFFN